MHLVSAVIFPMQCFASMASGKAQNRGISVGFIKLSECRMAGEHIALCRILRLQGALSGTVNLAEFVALCNFKKETSIIQSDDFLKYLFTMCHALYSPMRELRLVNQKNPAMDKLHFYVCQTDTNLFKYLRQASTNAQLCTNTRILSLMSTCEKGVDINNDDDKDLSSDNEVDDGASKFSVDSDESELEETDDEDNKEVASGDDGDDMVNFFNETIGAGCGQLRQVQYVFIFLSSSTILYSS
jgi:hypothetical protein